MTTLTVEVSSRNVLIRVGNKILILQTVGIYHPRFIQIFSDQGTFKQIISNLLLQLFEHPFCSIRREEGIEDRLSHVFRGLRRRLMYQSKIL